MVAPDLIGRVFSRLTVIARAPNRRHAAYWVCRCSCGTVTHPIRGDRLRRGTTQSCGCLGREVAAVAARSHGKCTTAEYYVWSGMLRRCHTPTAHAYERYGGRGITVCEAWRHDFAAFLRDMGPRPTGQRYTLERRNGALGYSPDNCYWATYKTQNRNRRISHPIGEYGSIAEAAERLNIPHQLIRRRLSEGWTDHDAIAVPKSTSHIRKRLKLPRP